MKIFLFSRQGIDITADEMSGILDSISRRTFDWAVNDWLADHIRNLCGIVIPQEKRYSRMTPGMAKDAIMISYGGDGTFLDAVRFLGDISMPILGVNFGHLGFLANVPKSEIKNIFSVLESGGYTLEERSLLSIEGDFTEGPEHPYALNDIAIRSRDITMTAVDVSVEGEKLATYRGDGVIISTPTGSTAYSLSVGGPIVSPECRCFIVSPIATHNLTMRPVVIPDDKEVSISIDSREPEALLSIDNTSFRVKAGSRFRVTKANKSVFLVKLQNISFYDTLRNKMMWGIDGRDREK